MKAIVESLDPAEDPMEDRVRVTEFRVGNMAGQVVLLRVMFRPPGLAADAQDLRTPAICLAPQQAVDLMLKLGQAMGFGGPDTTPGSGSPPPVAH